MVIFYGESKKKIVEFRKVVEQILFKIVGKTRDQRYANAHKNTLYNRIFV